MNSIRFYKCDCIEGMETMPEQSVDVVITSPPYNIGTKYRVYDDTDSREQYLLFTALWSQSVRRLLKPSGSLFLNVAGKPTDPWVPFEVASTFRQQLILQNVIHWVKSITVGEETHGHFKPINSPRFLNACHEYIFHFTHQGDVHLNRTAIGVRYKDESNIRRWTAAGRDQVHCRGDCWHIPYITRQAKTLHPATFPMLLVEKCLRLHGLPPKEFRSEFHVLDPFMGIGTTAIVAAKLGLSCVGFDVDEEYLRYAAAHVEAMYGIQCDLSIGAPEINTE